MCPGALHRLMCNPKVLGKSTCQSVTWSTTLLSLAVPRPLSRHGLLDNLTYQLIRVFLQACPELIVPDPALLHIGETETPRAWGLCPLSQLIKEKARTGQAVP